MVHTFPGGWRGFIYGKEEEAANRKPQQTQDAKPQAPCWEFGVELSLDTRINQKPAEGPSSLGLCHWSMLLKHGCSTCPTH